MTREKSASARRKRRRAGKCNMLMMFFRKCDTKMSFLMESRCGWVECMPATELDIARADELRVVDWSFLCKVIECLTF